MADPALLTKLCVALFVITSLFHSGLALTVAEVRSPLRDWRLVVGALIGNFVLVPAAAMLIARLFDLADGLSLGLPIYRVMEPRVGLIQVDAFDQILVDVREV